MDNFGFISGSGSGSPSAPNIYGEFYDTTTQTTATNVPKAMRYNTNGVANGVSVINDGLGFPTIIKTNTVGVYNIQFSAQLSRTSGGQAKQVIIWLRKNGTNIPNTSTIITMQANDDYIVAAWNFFVALLPADELQLMWAQTDNIEILYQAENLLIPYPAVPSVILTVNKIN